MPSPCPCRGCTAAYKQGVADGHAEVGKLNTDYAVQHARELREARRQSYRDGYNAACKARAQADWVYTGRIIGVSSCGWPFHYAPDCVECGQHEERYGENVDRYLDALAAKTRDRKAARRQASPQSVQSHALPGDGSSETTPQQ